ncbi:GNAT family N-acetyltransferase [Nonomuraea sp. NPDC050202]|uniref:GNAT family N-acetyltransferase n=1 Tax=Nonomuraea sp. NPDC050202 TaxID=3155035 RepID=UPI003411D024
MIDIGKLLPADRNAWEGLFRAYIDFYERVEPDEMYDRAWQEFQADTRLHALGARLDGRLVGITHFLTHGSTSAPDTDVCYLQDLFAAPDVRGKGVGRALIAAVADWAGGAAARACTGTPMSRTARHGSSTTRSRRTVASSVTRSNCANRDRQVALDGSGGGRADLGCVRVEPVVFM